MIYNVKIKNFQSIKECNIDLGNITVIIGDSDQGKSAFIRALNGVSTNKNSSDHVTFGEEFSEVQIKLEDDVIVKWLKGGSKNGYIINNEIEYNSVGRNSIPKEVADILKIESISTGKKGEEFFPQIAVQKSEPFLLREGGTTLNRVINKLTKSELLSVAILNNKRTLNAYKKELTIRRSDLIQLEKNRNKFLKFNKYEVTIDKISQAIKQLTNENKLIEQKIKNLKVLHKIKKEKIKIMSIINSIDICLKSISDYNKCYLSYTNIFSKINKFIKLKNVVIVKNRILKHLSTIDNVLNEFNKKCTNLETRINNIQLNKKLNQISINRLGVKESIDLIANNILTTNKEFEEAILIYKKCPTCGAQLKKENINYIMEEL